MASDRSPSGSWSTITSLAGMSSGRLLSPIRCFSSSMWDAVTPSNDTTRAIAMVPSSVGLGRAYTAVRVRALCHEAPRPLTAVPPVRTIDTEAGRRRAVRVRVWPAAIGMLAIMAVAAAAAGAAAPPRAPAPAHTRHAHLLATARLGAQMFAAPAGGKLIYHGGPVMSAPTQSIAIFWHPAHLQSGSRARVSDGYDRILKRYLTDVGGKGL